MSHQRILGLRVCARVDSPFLCLVNNVTDLHVERPVLTLQGPISGLLCDKHITVTKNCYLNIHHWNSEDYMGAKHLYKALKEIYSP